MSTSRVAQLANTISRCTALIDDYLHQNNLSVPSFEVDGPIDALAGAPLEIQNARTSSVEASIELQQRLQGTPALLFPETNMTSLQAIYRFQIANKFPIDGEISYSELADRCDLQEHDLRRIIRYAVVHHRVFQEPRKGIVSHTAASKMLAESKQIQDVMALTFEECWPAHAKTVDALCKFPKSQEPNESGYALANNTTESMFTFLQLHPDRAQRFASAMSTSGTAGMALLSELYPWGSLPTGSVVVDVGGARGHVSAYLAEKFPRLKFVVQDLPEVVMPSSSAGSGEAAYEIPEAIRDRVELMGHDFFTEQPVKDAAVYFIRYTFHNWSDAYCVKILQNLRPALKAGAHIVIQDHILPEPGALSLLRERETRAMDLIMLSLQNSREREKGDWIALVKMADERFEFTSAKRQSEDSASAVIVLTWMG